MLLATVGSLGFAAAAVAQTQDPTPAPTTLDELVVTAQKREQALVDVPVAVSALTEESLEARGVNTLQDAVGLVPGLSLRSSGRGVNTVVLRGISTGRDTSATVGTVVDGVPVGSSSSVAYANAAQLDFDPSDVARVEVLRGPQGTLYGASTLGGLISYVTKAPDPSSFSGDGRVEIATIQRGESEYAGRLALNIPLITDKAALRVSLGGRQFGGFIDNSRNGQSDVNGGHLANALAVASYRPTDSLELRAGFIFNEVEKDNSDSVRYSLATGEPARGSLDRLQTSDEVLAYRFSQYYVSALWETRYFDVSAVSAYSVVKPRVNTDFGEVGLNDFLGIDAAVYAIDSRNSKSVHEVKLTSKESERFNWIVGGFYTRETGEGVERLIGLLGGSPVPSLNPGLRATLDSVFKEYALFGNAAYHVLSNLELSAGARLSRNEQTYTQGTFGPLTAIFGVDEGFEPAASSSEDVSTYSFSARWTFAPSANLYARVASAYRPGGPNVTLAGVPPSFESDSLVSYEVGVKAQFLDGRGLADAAAFHIDWADIQLVATHPTGIGFFANGGGAVSRGLEAAIQFQATDSLTLGATAAFTDSHFDEAAPDLEAGEGERLPNIPKTTIALTADYEGPESGGWSPFLNGTLRYVGDRTSSYNQSASRPQLRLDEYLLADARVGLVNDAIRLTLYAKNIADKRAELFAQTSAGIPRVTITQPRTFGFVVERSF
jgi:outer membrane receptor protein involved in Fe transport